jgi:putative hydrolase of the HAD superfamily
VSAGVTELELESLVRDVGLLSLDAGNTVIFLDHDRLARLLGRAGYDVTPEALAIAEGEAKRRLEDDSILKPEWAQRSAAAVGWGNVTATMCCHVGVPFARVGPLLDSLWDEHVRFNLYSRVPDGLGAALDAIRAAGVKVVVVSNSEGMLDGLFADLGIAAHFDRIVDSGKVGVEKPDPRIFTIALEGTGVTPARALHLGDTYATDVIGARRAGLRAAFIDPFGHYEGRHLDVPRVPGVVAVADAIRKLLRA